MISTADICDVHPDAVKVAEPIFRSYGGVTDFFGPIETIKTFEDNSLVRATLETPGEGRVLVVDGGGSLRCALLGDQLAALAVKNGWIGILIFGCVRDSVALAQSAVGIYALNTHPRKSKKQGLGDRNVTVSFAGIDFLPGHFLYADNDGILVADHKL